MELNLRSKNYIRIYVIGALCILLADAAVAAAGAKRNRCGKVAYLSSSKKNKLACCRTDAVAVDGAWSLVDHVKHLAIEAEAQKARKAVDAQCAAKSECA